MTSIEPERIADIIGNHIVMLDKGELEIDCKLPHYESPITVQERVLAEPEITLDTDWVEDWFMGAEIYDYVIEKVRISDLKFNKLFPQGYRIVPLAKMPAYQYLQGQEKAYKDYMEMNRKYEPDSEHNEQRFREFLRSCNDSGYDESRVIVVDGMYMILDGAHRASWLMNKYGVDYEVKVLKLYRKM